MTMQITAISMPTWGLTMEEGTLVEWLVPEGAHVARNEYALPAIKHNLGIFLDRFFRTSQFKRSCVPNAPKVGTGGSLSPRGDWRAPSDSESVVWMNDLKNIPVD